MSDILLATPSVLLFVNKEIAEQVKDIFAVKVVEAVAEVSELGLVKFCYQSHEADVEDDDNVWKFALNGKIGLIK